MNDPIDKVEKTPEPEKPSLMPVPSHVLEESEPLGSDRAKPLNETPPPVRPMPWREWLPRTLLEQAELVMRLVIIGAAAFSIHQYITHTQAERTKRTLEYIDRFENGEVAQAYRTIVSVVYLSSEYVAASVDKNQSAAAQAAALSAVVIAIALDFKHDKGTGIAVELDSVIGFIGSLQVCVEQELCDGKLSRAFFAATAGRLLENFQPYVLRRRQTDPNYGLQFEKFVAGGVVKTH